MKQEESKLKQSLSEVHSSVRTNQKGWKRIFAFLGPAYLVSVGYMDPGNWATDIAGGSEFGYKLIWVLLMSNIMAVLLQTLSARLGVVAGMDLAQASKNAYPKWANIPLYIIAEIAIAACDLAEIIGMAIGLNLLFDLPLIWGVSITVLDTFLLLFLINKGIRLMEAFIVSMVGIIGISFLIEMLIVSPQYNEVVTGLVPSSLEGDALYIAIGIIGATVMPHNLYLHSSLVQSRKITRTVKGIKSALRLNFIDTIVALNLAFFVNAAILILAAAAFYVNGYYNVAEIQEASDLLGNLFGSIAPSFFAIALIAAGQSSTITGTLAGQIVMEGHLNLRIQPWLRRLITRLIAVVPALIAILYFGEDSLGGLLILSQVVLSLQLGFAVIPLIHFNSDKTKMGEFTIKPWLKIAAWITAFLIVYLNIKLVIEEIHGWLEAAQNPIWIYTLVIPLILICLALLIYVFVQPFISNYSATHKTIPHGGSMDIVKEDLESYHEIALTIDFSGNEQKVISNALRQGGKQAHYTFIHVVESAAARYLGDSVNDYETHFDKAQLNNYVDELKKMGYRADLEVGYGNAALEIARIVNEKNIQLLVMGAHGHKGIKDMIFGTTLDKVRHRIDIPLLIIV